MHRRDICDCNTTHPLTKQKFPRYIIVAESFLRHKDEHEGWGGSYLWIGRSNSVVGGAAVLV